MLTCAKYLKTPGSSSSKKKINELTRNFEIYSFFDTWTRKSLFHLCVDEFAVGCGPALKLDVRGPGVDVHVGEEQVIRRQYLFTVLHHLNYHSISCMI